MVGTLQQSLTFNEIDDAVGALAVASPMVPAFVAETGATVIGRSMAHTRADTTVSPLSAAPVDTSAPPPHGRWAQRVPAPSTYRS